MNKNVIYAALMFVVTMSSGNASAQQFPYQNPALSAHERAVDLCGRLTLEEKASLMLDDSPAIPRLGIKRFQWWSEALHGVANMGDVTVFPEPIGMAASFNDRMVYRVFDATSDEMRAKWNELQQKGGDVTRFHALSVRTPNVNIFRDPRWGRGQETYGEDPYLTSRMGCAVVRGLQGPEDTKYRKLGLVPSTMQFIADRNGLAIQTILPMLHRATFGKLICLPSNRWCRMPRCVR